MLNHFVVKFTKNSRSSLIDICNRVKMVFLVPFVLIVIDFPEFEFLPEELSFSSMNKLWEFFFLVS